MAQTPTRTPQAKICPECAESVPTAARVCRYCGHSFERGLGKVPRVAVWLIATGVGAAIATSASLVGPGVYHHFFRAVTKTRVVIMRPSTADRLISSLQVVGHDRGSCRQRSLADFGNPQAHRCYGNSSEIHDPCFELLYPQLVRMLDPWTKHVTLITATDEFAPPSPLKENVPWALELKTGAHCVMSTGATESVAGLRLNYFCEQGSVYGVPDRSHDLWYVTYAPEGRTDLGRVAVRTAWY